MAEAEVILGANIVGTILEDGTRQPLVLSSEELTRRADLPLEWREQQRLLISA